MDPATLQFERFRRCGDLEALGRAFDLVSPRLLALALHLTGNAADAEDALQATFVVAMQKATAFDPGKPIGPWLAGVLAGEASNLRRREHRRRTEAFDEATLAVRRDGSGGDGLAEAERRDAIAQLRTRIEALPDDQRQVLLLQLQHGLRPAEIAEVLGMAPGTVRMRLHRGLEALRKVLPAGLVALLAMGTARRGLAAVREAVLMAGSSAATAASSGVALVTIGGVMLGKTILAAVLVLAGLLLWRTFVVPPAAVVPLASTAGPVPAVGRLGETGGSSTADRIDPGEPERRAATPEPVVALPASLHISVRGIGPRDQEPTVHELQIPDEGTAPLLPGLVVELGPASSQKPRSYDPRWQRQVVDGTGRCAFEGLPPGSYLVDVEQGGALAQRQVELQAGEQQSLELLVQIAGEAHGRVVDADGRAVVGAEIWIGGRFDDVTPPHQRVRKAGQSDEAGRFRVCFRSVEEYVAARAPGTGASRSHLLQQLGDAEVVLVLERDFGLVRGVIADDIGRPIADATVTLEGIDASLRETRREADGSLVGPRLGVVVLTDARGSFAVDGLVADRYRLRAVRPPNQTVDESFHLTRGEQRELRLTMPRRAVVSGRVVRRDGRPCQGVHVAVTYGDGSSHPDLTDEHGAFQFRGVTLRPYELLATRFGSKQVLRRAMPAPTPEGVEVELVLDETPRLFGTLRSADGLPLRSWFVSLGEGAAARREPTDAQGRFSIVDVEAGSHLVAVHRLAEQAASPVLRTELTADVAADLRVPAAAMPFGEVRGRVVVPEGLPLSGVACDMPFVATEEGSADADGSFRFAKLMPGTHWLRLRAPGCVEHLQAVELGDRAVVDVGTVALVRAAGLRVRYRTPDGAPWRGRPPTPYLKNAEGHVLSEPSEVRYTVEGDEVVAVGIRPGTYRICGRPNDELLMLPTSVVLVGGEQRREVVTVQLARRRTLMARGLGELADEDGQVAVVVLGENDTPLLEDRVRLEDGCATTTLMVPVGSYTVEVRGRGRVVARGPLEVGPELDDSPRIDVPRVP